MHSSRMCTARSLPYRGVSLTETAPWIENPPPPDREPLWIETPIPCCEKITNRCKNITFPQLRLRAVNIVRCSLTRCTGSCLRVPLERPSFTTSGLLCTKTIDCNYIGSRLQPVKQDCIPVGCIPPAC